MTNEQRAQNAQTMLNATSSKMAASTLELYTVEELEYLVDDLSRAVNGIIMMNLSDMQGDKGNTLEMAARVKFAHKLQLAATIANSGLVIAYEKSGMTTAEAGEKAIVKLLAPFDLMYEHGQWEFIPRDIGALVREEANGKDL